ncbi:hypothetical protein HDV62DRAFT_264314 [Trichoderma sp. SZMC 28011]
MPPGAGENSASSYRDWFYMPLTQRRRNRSLIAMLSFFVSLHALLCPCTLSTALSGGLDLEPLRRMGSGRATAGQMKVCASHATGTFLRARVAISYCTQLRLVPGVGTVTNGGLFGTSCRVWSPCLFASHDTCWLSTSCNLTSSIDYSSPIPCFFSRLNIVTGRAPCHARKARPELTRLFKVGCNKAAKKQQDKDKEKRQCMGHLHPRRWGCRSATKRLGSRGFLLEKPGFYCTADWHGPMALPS